jgi:hypothetical protein
VGPEVWLLIWYCVTTTNPAGTKWDRAFENLISFKSEAECVSYGTKVASEVHKSFNIKLEYICRKGVPLEPNPPNRRPSFQSETYGATKRVK